VLVSQIAAVLGVSESANLHDREIAHLLTDSRSLVFPGESLFFALKSERNDGHRYIRELYQKGVRAFVVSTMPDSLQYAEAAFLVVEDGLRALQTLAAHHRSRFRVPVVAITGSNGKTIVKEWLYQLLSPDFRIVRSPRSYNSQIGVALSVWQLHSSAGLAVFEAGISRPGEMARLEQIIQPDTGIFTTLGDAHQENFESLEQKLREKAGLFRHCTSVVYCSDQEPVARVLGEMLPETRLVNWGRGEDAVVRVLDMQVSETTMVELSYKSANYSIVLPFSDRASIENALHCVVYMLISGYSGEVINKRLAVLESVAMRLEVKEGLRQCVIINDSYNSDVDSLRIALDFLNQQASSLQLSKTLILSDILQSGFSQEELYRKVAELARARRVKRIIAIGPDVCNHQALFSAFETRFFQHTDELLHSDVPDSFHREAILIKGARSFHFEAISSRLEKVAHETTLEVNLNNLIHNLNYFRSKLNPGTRMMCMVKAFAYGSGSVEIARTLQHHRVDYLAVAVADEGAELRHAGIHIPIAVMNPEKSVFDLLFEHQLEPEIYSFRLLNEFIAAAARRGIQSYPIHIKLDSGMHRLGFDPADVPDLIELLQLHSEVSVKSVFSHLAGADSPALDAFTHQQASVFAESANRFKKAFAYPVMRHLLNSAGIERFGQYQMEMVRLGIGHYGISALPEMTLPQVCSLKTIILQIKDIPAGETVGYNRNGKVVKPSRIAILPVGYADGFDRKLSNGVGEVLIKGKRVPVIGNVSMDLITVDITGVEVQEGDAVEVFGDEITITEIASKIGTIPYEILTGISRRVKRVYYQE
jgi:alanine racemase